MSLKTDEIDQAILSYVGVEPVSVLDLTVHYGGRIGTYRNSLRRLLQQKAVERRWDGNQRFGRFLYFRSTEK